MSTLNFLKEDKNYSISENMEIDGNDKVSYLLIYVFTMNETAYTA